MSAVAGVASVPSEASTTHSHNPAVVRERENVSTERSPRVT